MAEFIQTNFSQFCNLIFSVLALDSVSRARSHQLQTQFGTICIDNEHITRFLGKNYARDSETDLKLKTDLRHGQFTFCWCRGGVIGVPVVISEQITPYMASYFRQRKCTGKGKQASRDI